MTSIIFVTQMIDSNDPVLGFVHRQVSALAARGARVAVVANQVGAVPADLGAHELVSLGKERGWARARRFVTYEAALVRLARQLRPAVLFAHMCPIYMNLGAPVVKACGGRTILWFAHYRDSVSLAVAEHLSDVVLTTLPGSYPRTSPRLRVIGQAVDTDRFPFTPPARTPRATRLVAVGRIAPVKDYPTLIRGVAAARAAGTNATLEIVGPTLSPGDQQIQRDLLGLCDRLGISSAVTFSGAVPHDQVPERIRAADALINATCGGSADKAVFEAMASGRPVMASNAAFADLLAGTQLGLIYRSGDDQDLAERIVSFAAASDDAVRASAEELRTRIERGHSLDHWATTVLSIADELTAGGKRGAGTQTVASAAAGQP